MSMPRAWAFPGAAPGRASGSRLIVRRQIPAVKVRPVPGITLEMWLILGYVAVNGVADLRAAKVGFHAGPMPLFLTDITLMMLLTASLVRWPSRILFWISTGTGAGSIGLAVWILSVMAVVYWGLAFDKYPLYSTRDLAIFLYSLYFPLTYFAIRRRRDAALILRCLTYAGIVSASLLIFQEITGISVGLFDTSFRVVLGHKVAQLRSGNANIFALFALASLLAYVMLEHRFRGVHVACAIVCFLSLAAATVRSGVVAVLLATAATYYSLKGNLRLLLLLLAAALALPVVFAPRLPAGMPGVRLLRGFRISISSAVEGPSADPDSEFRIVRWKYATRLWLTHPLLGTGFGRAIVPAGLVDREERRGRFNAGMPHNSFLTILTRTGLLGFALFCCSWIFTLTSLLTTVRRKHRADDLAAANLLAAMFGCAMLGLFIERPETNASFWIVMAVSRRLLES